MIIEIMTSANMDDTLRISNRVWFDTTLKNSVNLSNLNYLHLKEVILLENRWFLQFEDDLSEQKRLSLTNMTHKLTNNRERWAL